LAGLRLFLHQMRRDQRKIAGAEPPQQVIEWPFLRRVFVRNHFVGPLARRVPTLTEHIRLLCVQVHRQLEQLCDGFARGNRSMPLEGRQRQAWSEFGSDFDLGASCQARSWNPRLPTTCPPCPMTGWLSRMIPSSLST